jgi:hypothetical protein
VRGIACAGLLLALLSTGCNSERQQVWFTPDVGSRDMLALFSQPQLWPRSRARVTVFKFYAGQVLASRTADCPICGDNLYPNFIQVDAFRRLRSAGIATAIEVAAVKPAECTAEESIPYTLRAIENVAAAGGRVSYLAMDEPRVSAAACGQSTDDAAAQVADFVRRVRAAHPDVIVGDIEPYPLFSVAETQAWLDAVQAQGVTLGFLHLDVDRVHAARVSADVSGDVLSLSTLCRQRALPFGVILVGVDGSTDQSYYDDVLAWAGTLATAIGRPDHIVFQSWVAAPDGSRTVPINLPENDPAVFSHTRLILDGLQRFTTQ